MHCECGHNAPPHRARWCHRCDCTQFLLCLCEKTKPYCTSCGIPHKEGQCKR